MFGRGRTTRRNSTFSNARLRNAALVGAGMLALRWWRNRQARDRNPSPESPHAGTRNDRAMYGE
jgi:hypothetical protein